MPFAGAAFTGSAVIIVIVSNRTQIRRGAACYASSLTYALASTGTGVDADCFFFQSPIAARIASSARTEQWILTGGSESSFTISVFLIARASSMVLPLTHSVASEDDAMADPQPNVLNFASSMTLVAGLTLICSFITSPHSGAPTSPVPTSALVLSMDPTLRGLL